MPSLNYIIHEALHRTGPNEYVDIPTFKEWLDTKRTLSDDSKIGKGCCLRKRFWDTLQQTTP